MLNEIHLRRYQRLLNGETASAIASSEGVSKQAVSVSVRRAYQYWNGFPPPSYVIAPKTEPITKVGLTSNQSANWRAHSTSRKAGPLPHS